MIVREFEDHYELVNQSAHALLAERLLKPWQELMPALDWPSLLLATTQHDQGWNPTDLRGTLNGDKPLNFLDVKLQEAARISQRSVDWAFAQDVKSGILVAEHFHFLYGRKETDELQEMGEELAHRRDRALADCGLSQDWLKQHYKMLFWADTLSLLIVCRPSSFTRALSLKTDQYQVSFTQHSPEEYSLSPWPFAEKSYRYEYEFRRCPGRAFAAEDELAEVLTRAEVHRRKVVIRA